MTTTEQAISFYEDMAKVPYSAIDMQEAAKALGVEGMDKNRLYAFLRNEGILTSSNHPYQEYIDLGYFAVVIRNKPEIYGTQTRAKTLVYPEGLKFIHSLIQERSGKKSIKLTSYKEIRKKQEKKQKQEKQLHPLDRFIIEAEQGGAMFL